jgi:hypothetical protein
MLPVCLLVTFIAQGTPTAVAQGVCGGQGNYNLRATPTALDYGAVSQLDLDAGQIDAGAMTVTIVPRGKPNFDWRLCLRGGAIGFGVKPIEDVEWQVAGEGAWHPVSSAEQLVATGQGRADLDVRFRVALSHEDAPHFYEALLTFAVARQ